jgi:hypothetical protein
VIVAAKIPGRPSVHRRPYGKSSVSKFLCVRSRVKTALSNSADIGLAHALTRQRQASSKHFRFSLAASHCRHQHTTLCEPFVSKNLLCLFVIECSSFPHPINSSLWILCSTI